ncbi:MAG: HEAT repeat domain-containing protein [Sedimentisphaerales bacterium]|nr:HEAT repeat domain-containing protein [Sedimentisphaerales bacterium]
MKATLIISFLIAFIIFPISVASARPPHTRGRGYANVYRHGVGRPYSHYRRDHRMPSSYCSPYYGRTRSLWPHYRGPYIYWRKPVRYHLPWNRPELVVTAQRTGGLKYYKHIPEVTLIKLRSEPTELIQPVSFVPREQFLIESVLRRSRGDRILAIRELCDYKKITSVAVLTDALINDHNNDVRAEAAHALRVIGLPIAYEALVRAAASEKAPEVRAAIDEAMKTIKEKAGSEIPSISRIPPSRHGTQKLADYLDDLRYGRAKVRETAVEKLRSYKDTRVVAALINALINDPDKEVREEAAASLGEISDRMALPFLRSARNNDIENSVQKEARQAIREIHDNI